MASKKCLSESAHFRELGNAAYRNATEDLAPCLQLSRLQQAANNYDKALSKAKDNTDRSSACKNLAMTYWKMAKANMAAHEGDIVNHYFRDALRNFKDAKEYGKGRNSEWMSGLVSSELQCWNDLQLRMEDWQEQKRFQEVVRLVGYITDDAMMAEEHLRIANDYFNKSVMVLAERKYQQSLQLLGECSFPLNEARRLLNALDDPTRARECEVLEEDIFIQTCVAESMQARTHGEKLLTLVLQNEEDLNVDMVWDVVDWFRRAAMLTREHDIELEAMALSALGRVYDKVLKMKDRAKPCLKKVLELAGTMVPRVVWNCEWYEFARATLERYQQESLRSEETEEQKKREEVLKLIKEDLDKINAVYPGPCASVIKKMEFLKFVYINYPPKDKRHVLKEFSADIPDEDVKKRYRAAAVHYHPDKVDEAKHGAAWKALSGEISKLVNSVYENVKQTSPDAPQQETY